MSCQASSDSSHAASPSIELLAPARDLECGLAAINCGADAVYVGPPRFGARENAGNDLQDIEKLARHAHRYWARVYATLNTLLKDEEIDEAVRLAHDLYDAGVDGLIIQDTGLLECERPPLPLIASTQMHNASPERVAFLEQVGFKRAILARELSLDDIAAIRRAAPEIELEFFVHGALCVSYSGQCYLSYAQGGRSGNRGACAQPCRRLYDLVDEEGAPLGPRRHWLSLRDLNLSENLGELLDAGISSFKIEGRLKDKAYVANIISHYRQQLDAAMNARGLRKSSSGHSEIDFEPDPIKTFNRGFTSYFLHGRKEPVGRPETPKMLGEPLGKVVRITGEGVELETKVALRPGDGLCWIEAKGEMRGSTLNRIAPKSATTVIMHPDRVMGLGSGVMIWRNHDHEFLTRLAKSKMERRMNVTMTLRSCSKDLVLEAVDEDDVRARVVVTSDAAAAEKPERASETIARQLSKGSDTEFEPNKVCMEAVPVPFLPIATLNAARREVLELLSTEREKAWAEIREKEKLAAEQSAHSRKNNVIPFPETELTYRGNVLNEKAETFYRRHGVGRIERAAETGGSMEGRALMTMRHCLKHQLDLCKRFGGSGKLPGEKFWLVDEERKRLELRFKCAECLVELWLG